MNAYDKVVDYDAVVIGAGLAGLSAALRMVERDPSKKVAVVSKVTLGQGGSSPWAQGGVAVALPADDQPELHAQDTVQVGVGLNHDETVNILTSEGRERVLELVAMGARFDRTSDGQLAFGREAAHSRRRVVHAGDATGAEMMRTMVEELVKTQVSVWADTFAHELFVHENAVAGVLVTTPTERVLMRSSAVVLATGGCGQLFRYTTNPAESTGDGLALAYRAGARLRDLEFVQFHPTALNVGSDGKALPLVTEALRGEGSKLIDEKGHRFAFDSHPDGELAPRDVVARCIWQHRREGHEAFLDATHLGDSFPVRFPTVFGLCQQHGIDPRVEAMPVTPAVHYHMGGVEVDSWGRTTVAGLWACGEVASTGVHGANRLASNSLLEALVFGHRVADDILKLNPLPTSALPLPGLLAQPNLEWRWSRNETLVVARLRDILWDKCGLARTLSGLSQATQQLDRLQAQGGEAANMLLMARLLVRSALARCESRGAHYRLDYPETRKEWAVHLVVQKAWNEPRREALPGQGLEALVEEKVS